MNWQLAICWITSSIAWTVHGCPTRCFCVKDVVTCTDVRSLPVLIPASTSELTFHGLNVTRIPAHAFDGLPNLRSLEFYSSYIGSIESFAFSGISGIDFVTVYGSAIGTISSFAFSGIHNVSLISIYNTNIRTIESMSFSHMTNVRDWQLYSLEIRMIAPFAFHNISGISSFTFYSNKIAKLKTTAFSNFSNIEDFKFYMNAVDYIECNNIEPMLTQAKTVKFYNNKFQCACTLVWMLRSELLKNKMSSNECSFPNIFKFIPLSDVIESDLTCVDYDNRFIIGCPPKPSPKNLNSIYDKISTNQLPANRGNPERSPGYQSDQSLTSDATVQGSPGYNNVQRTRDRQSDSGHTSQSEIKGQVMVIHKTVLNNKGENSGFPVVNAHSVAIYVSCVVTLVLHYSL